MSMRVLKECPLSKNDQMHLPTFRIFKKYIFNNYNLEQNVISPSDIILNNFVINFLLYCFHNSNKILNLFLHVFRIWPRVRVFSFKTLFVTIFFLIFKFIEYLIIFLISRCESHHLLEVKSGLGWETFSTQPIFLDYLSWQFE